MAFGLYEPDECESERTVIISELQGGENDPDQLLDTEVTATAFRQHPYRHPTIGWLDDLRAMTRDDLYGHYRLLLRPRQRDPRRRWSDRRRRRAPAGGAALRPYPSGAGAGPVDVGGAAADRRTSRAPRA